MYRNCTYKINKEAGWIGEIVLDTWDEDGNPATYIYPHRSHLYYETPIGTDTSIFGTKIKKEMFDSIIERRRWIDKHPNTKIFDCLPPVREFLIERFRHANSDLSFSKYPLRVHFFDLEVAVEEAFPSPEVAGYPINVMTIYDSRLQKYIVWLNTTETGFVDSENITHRLYSSEHDMLMDFTKWHKHNYPDVYTGWNIERFDIPYLINRLSRVLGPDYFHALSPLNEVKKLLKSQRGDKNEFNSYQISGLSVLDYYSLYKYKFPRGSKASYKLGDIGEEELGLGKLEFEGTFKEFYKNDFKRFVEYNIMDVKICVELDKKLKYINLSRTISNIGLCEYESIFKSSPSIIGALTIQAKSNSRQLLARQAIADVSDNTDYEGAFVFQTKAGVYRNGIAYVDFNSLYPNIMISLNISPETKVGKILEKHEDHMLLRLENGNVKKVPIEKFNEIKKDLTISANNILYVNPNKRVGLIPEFLDKLYNRRKSIKSKMGKLAKTISEFEQTPDHDKHKLQQLTFEYECLDQEQSAVKVFLNAIYGQMGNKYFPLFDLDNAEAITLTGQKIIKESAKFINGMFGEDVIIGGDTDSTDFDTVVRTTKGILKIGDLYDMYIDKTDNITTTPNGHEIISLTDDSLKIANYKDSKLVYSPISKLVRHKVTKKKYKIISESGKEVIITGDHSVMVYSSGVIIRVKASEITIFDQLIVVNDDSVNFENIQSVECIGQFDDEYVFDIEVNDDTHTFFGNDILLHNSLFVDIYKLVKETFPGESKINWTNANVKKIVKVLDTTTIPTINENCNKIMFEEFNSPLHRIEFKREAFAPYGIFPCKKRYVLNIRDKEGILVNEFKYTGVDIKKNEIPKKIKEKLKVIIESSLVNEWDSTRYHAAITAIKQEFVNMDIEDIAFIKNYSTEKDKDSFLKAAKGAGAHAKAAIYFNQLIDKLNLKHKYDEIKVGDRLRFVYLYQSNPFGIEVIGWKDKFPSEFNELFEIDYKKMFNKVVMSPLKRFEAIYGWGNVDAFSEFITDINSL